MAGDVGPRTVSRMDTPDPSNNPVVHTPVVPLPSAVTTDGHLLLLRVPSGAAVLCDWLDGNTADVTSWAPDLALTGWLDLNEVEQTGRREPAETVEVAKLRVAPEHAAQDITATYVHLPTRDSIELTLEQVLAFASRGINVQLTAGIAHEAADLPDTAAGL